MVEGQRVELHAGGKVKRAIKFSHLRDTATESSLSRSRKTRVKQFEASPHNTEIDRRQIEHFLNLLGLSHVSTWERAQ